VHTIQRTYLTIHAPTPAMTTNVDANMENGHETLLSILCRERWHWDSEEWSEIVFNENNTGEVREIHIAPLLPRSMKAVAQSS
jgi:hypothetical protein